MIHFDEHIFQMGWFSHQPVNPMLFSHPKNKKKSEFGKKTTHVPLPTTGDLPDLPTSSPFGRPQGLATHRTAAPWIFRGRVRGVVPGAGEGPDPLCTPFVVWFQRKNGACMRRSRSIHPVEGVTRNMELNKLCTRATRISGLDDDLSNCPHCQGNFSCADLG